jgi:hypothetical protein
LSGLGSPVQGHIDMAMRVLDQATTLIEKNQGKWVPCSDALTLYDKLKGLFAAVEENLGVVTVTGGDWPTAVQENVDFLEVSLSTLKDVLDDCFDPEAEIGLWVGKPVGPPQTPPGMLNGLEACSCGWR